MVLTIQQHESKYIQTLCNVYNHAIDVFPLLDKIDIQVNGRIEPGLSENIHMSKGTEEDEGKYMLSIKFSDNNEQVKNAFALGLTMILMDFKYSNIALNDLTEKQNQEFISTYTTLNTI